MARIRKFKPPKIVTVIGQGTVIKGDITFAGGLHIEGKICGNVYGETETNSTLILSEHGEIEGELNADNLIINGRIKGDVHAGDRVELADNARVIGTVYYRLLEMAMGAEVNGQLIHSESKPPQRLGYDGSSRFDPPDEQEIVDAEADASSIADQPRHNS